MTGTRAPQRRHVGGPDDPDDWLRAAIDAARGAGHPLLPEPVGKRLLARHDIAVPRSQTVETGAQAAAVASQLAAPYVLKAVLPAVAHKSDVGGVQVGIESTSQLAAELTVMRERLQIAGHAVDGFLVEEQVPPGHELVVGVVRDPDTGPVVMVGLGGVFVEALRDVAFRLCPVRRGDVEQMLDELRGRAVLDGLRGRPKANVGALVELILAVAGPDGLVDQLPDDIVEIDLNPIVVSPRDAIAVDARLVLAGDRPAGAPARRQPPVTDFTALFEPGAVAVVGASARDTAPANLFIRNIRAYGYPGPIYPVHPTADEVEGLPAYPTVAALPERADYAYVAVRAVDVPAVLTNARGRLRFAQVISSGFGETAGGERLERRLLDEAERAGVRVLGPNCLGTHSSAGRLTFVERAPNAAGTVSVVSQSGGLSVDILRLGTQRGLRFRNVVSVGNGADVSPAELVEHFLADPGTAVVGLYLESLREGRRLFDVLRAAATTKPVVILAGGRTASGAKAAYSHTGALVGNHELWPALARQAGAVLVDGLAELLDALLLFAMRDPDTTAEGRDVVLFGNGGGTSVLASDALERAGLRVPQLSVETVDALHQLGLPPGTSFDNPLDAPAWTLAVDGGRVAEAILSTVLRTARPAAVISHLNVGVILSNTAAAENDVMSGLLDGIAASRAASGRHVHHLLVLRSDGDPLTEPHLAAHRERALRSGIPVFAELPAAAGAAAALLGYDAHRMPTNQRPVEE